MSEKANVANGDQIVITRSPLGTAPLYQVHLLRKGGIGIIGRAAEALTFDQAVESARQQFAVDD